MMTDVRRSPLLLAGLLCALPTTLTACSSGPSAAEQLTSTEQQVSHQTSVNFVDVTTEGKSNKVITGLLGPVDSQETLTVDGSPVLQVRLLRVTAYVYTDSQAILTAALGLSAAQAAAHVNQWIQVNSTDKPFNSITNSMTIDSAISIYFPTSSSVQQQGTKTIHGTELNTLTGTRVLSKTSAQESTIFVNPTTHLPAAGTIVIKSTTSTAKKEAVFRQWGYTFKVPMPAPVVTYTSITSS
jgi:hypothetical protein